MASIAVSSSDEDSFVILGSTPTPSILDQLEITRSPQQMPQNGVHAESPLLSNIDISAGSAVSAAAAAAVAAVAPSTNNTTPSSLTSAAILQHSQSGDQLPVPVGIRVEQWRARDIAVAVALTADDADSVDESLSVDSLSQPFSFLQVADNNGGDVVAAAAPRPQPVDMLEKEIQPTTSRESLFKSCGSKRNDDISSYMLRNGFVLGAMEEPQTESGRPVSFGSSALRQSVMDEFPSLAVSRDEEEVQKMESFLCDQVEMKENLDKANQMMLQHFRQLQQWQDSLSRSMAAKNRENVERQETNVKLQAEVLSLHKELTAMTEQVAAERAAFQAEKIELVQKVSNQNAMLMNMSGQIAQLEESLHTFEVVEVVRTAPPASSSQVAAAAAAEQTRTVELLNQTISELRTELGNMQRQQAAPLDDSMHANQTQLRQLRAELLDYQQKLVSANNSHEDAMRNVYELRDERQKLIDSLNAKLEEELEEKSARAQQLRTTQTHLSEVMAENIETREMKQIYVDQINCLEANVVAAEELVKQANARAAEHLAQAAEHTAKLADKERQLGAAHARISILEAQLEVYREDFETERKARQDIASEREEILSDLKRLQRLNQELTQNRAKPTSVSTSTSTASSASSASAVAQPSTSAGVAAAPSAPSAPKEMVRYECPVCTRVFPHLKTLETHVESCLSQM